MLKSLFIINLFEANWFVLADFSCRVRCFTCATIVLLHRCWTAAKWKHLISDPPCADGRTTCPIWFKSSTSCFQVSLQTSVWSAISPVTPARLLPRPLRRCCIVHTSAPPPHCFYGLSSTSVHPCCPYASACVQYTRVCSQPLSLALNFGWMARLLPAVLHLSTRRQGVSGPLHIPLLIISFNLEEKKESRLRLLCQHLISRQPLGHALHFVYFFSESE